MVGKWSCQNPLSLEERRKIQEGLEIGLSYSQIAASVERYKSTVMREAKRLGNIKAYDAEKAQENFEYIQRLRRKK